MEGMRIRPPKFAGNPALDLVIQHLTIDDAETVFFREIFYADDRRHAERKKLEGRSRKITSSG
jgi:hypothetical protein